MIIEQAGGKFRTGCMLILFIFVGMVLLFRWGCSGKNISQESQKINIHLILENTEFISQLASLELGERTTTEEITQSESRKLPLLPISTAKFTVRFEAKYVYTVSAETSKWAIEEKNGIVYVVAPELVAKEPSVDSSKIVATRSGGLLIFHKNQKLEALRSCVSLVARERANDKKSIDLMRETCRRSLEKFIAGWCRRYGIESNAVLVRFSEEKD